MRIRPLSGTDWYVAFMLELEYTLASLSEYGTRALEGVDRRNACALSTAADMLGIGELDFMFCRLLQEVTEYGKSSVVPFEYSSKNSSTVDVIEAYWDSGESYWGNLNWVSWDFPTSLQKTERYEISIADRRFGLITTQWLVWSGQIVWKLRQCSEEATTTLDGI